MRISTRTKSMAAFITLGVFLVALTVVVNVGWIVINWRRVAPLIFGVIFFGLIIAGLSVNTVFLVREIRRNEQQDSFLKAGEARQRSNRKNWQELDFSELVKSALDLTRLRHHLTPANLRFGAAPQEGLLVLGNPEELRTVEI